MVIKIIAYYWRENVMKKKIILAVILMLIFISACGRNNILEDETNNEISEENPFENIEEMTDNGWQVDYSYGWGITNYDPEECKITLNDDELLLDIVYNNTGVEFKAGIVIFIDGIAQKYTVDNQEGYVVPVAVQSGEQEETETAIQIRLKPQCVKEGREHTMYIGSVLEPEFRVKDIDNTYAHAMKISVQNNWTLYYDAEIVETNISTKSSTVPIDKSISDRYIYEEKDGKTTNKLKDMNMVVFEQDGIMLDESAIDISRKVLLKSVGGPVEKYRLCCMVNNEPYPAFDGCCYTDIEVSTENMTQVEMDFSKGNIDNLSVMYVVKCPIYDEITKDAALIDKTTNYTLAGQDVIEKSNRDNNVSNEEDNNISNVENIPAEFNNLKSYIEGKTCVRVKRVDEDVIACLFAEGRKKYSLELYDTASDKVLCRYDEGMQYTFRIDTTNNNIILYGGESIPPQDENIDIYVLDKKYEEIDRITVPSEIYHGGIAVIPSTKQIIYCDELEKEGFISCLKISDNNLKNEKILLKFNNKKMMFSPSDIKLSADEKILYCTGCDLERVGNDGNSLSCIAVVDVADKSYMMYDEEKTTMFIEGEDAFFYDDNAIRTDGKVIKYNSGQKVNEFCVKETDIYNANFENGSSLYWVLSQKKVKKNQEPRQVIRIYSSETGEMIYENKVKETIEELLIFEEEKAICAFFMGENGYECKVMNY